MILALLRDTAQVGAPPVTLRCAVTPNPRRSVGSVNTSTGTKCPYSVELICRVSSAPTVGSVITSAGRTGVVSATIVQDARGPWMRHARVFLTTRSDVLGGDITGDDTVVTVYPSVETIDTYGSVVRVPSATGVNVHALIAPTSATESHSDGQRRVQTWDLRADGDLEALGVDAYSTAVDYQGYTYALTGDPLVHTDPTGGSYSTATMRRVNEGEGS